MQIERAVSAAINECIKHNILKEYLTKQKSEATNMILTEFDQDAYEEMLKDEGRTEGILEGTQKGKAEGVLQSLQAVRLLREGKSISEISQETGMQVKDIEALSQLL